MERNTAAIGVAPKWLSAIEIIPEAALRSIKALGKISLKLDLPDHIQTHKMMKFINRYTHVIAGQNIMKDMLAQTNITTSETSTAIDLDAMAETETPTQDEED
ncbi:hypothetical protein CHS0354_010540 [Potamilus streckersoni]|uniref:Uncharacterized protein n=1 Tax=Potamilus streckersoni TaxID=2493646 RepID=A0AAE0S5X4_9BIVA|nr:hypothetical protein CHS0354_010540 [Potamilus streckersoni]